jgi:CO/xanthine dehydrogenase Mo-binding subunit
MIGQPVPRIDGDAKVTGRALYVDDLPAPAGLLHGATVRSAVAHGVLRAIRPDPAFDWTGVTLVTAADVPGRNVIALLQDDQPALVPAGGRIRHHDEPVALVAARDRRRAALAARHVLLDVEPLPPVLDPEASTHVFQEHAVRRGDVDAALASCDLVIEGTYRTGAQEQMYIEPQGMVAAIDDGGVCRVTGSMQCPWYVHKALKTALGLPDERVVVTAAVTGGGFGGKEEYPSVIAVHAALLALRAGAPVKLVYDRAEDVAATPKRHPARIRHRLGLLSDGTIVAADVDLLLDGGAYVTLSPVVLSRAVLHAQGPYRIPNVRVRGRVVATNAPPHGAFRGFGAPQVTFACERQVQKAARALGLDPFELRRRNALRPGDTTATGQTLRESVGSLAVLDAVARAAAAPAPASGPRAPGHHRRGRALAFWWHGAGFTGSGEERLRGRATVALARDGAFEVRTASTDIGQGTLTIFAQIAGDALGVPFEAVRLVEPSTAQVPDSGPTVASRTCMVVGGVVAEAARRLAARLRAWAAARGLDARDLAAVGAAHARDEGPAEETVAYAPPPGVRFDDASYTGDAYPVYGWAACLVELAVDPDTFEVAVERCVHAVDVGKAIHPVLVRGQIEGGTLQALGWALWEDVLYSGGRVANPRMTDCIIPTAKEAPELETLLVEEPYPFGPHGAKGVGEIPMDGPAAAVAGALEDALGVAVDELPARPELLERLCR